MASMSTPSLHAESSLLMPRPQGVWSPQLPPRVEGDIRIGAGLCKASPCPVEANSCGAARTTKGGSQFLRVEPFPGMQSEDLSIASSEPLQDRPHLREILEERGVE